jgi:hypothetical protein
MLKLKIKVIRCFFIAFVLMVCFSCFLYAFAGVVREQVFLLPVSSFSGRYYTMASNYAMLVSDMGDYVSLSNPNTGVVVEGNITFRVPYSIYAGGLGSSPNFRIDGVFIFKMKARIVYDALNNVKVFLTVRHTDGTLATVERIVMDDYGTGYIGGTEWVDIEILYNVPDGKMVANVDSVRFWWQSTNYAGSQRVLTHINKTVSFGKWEDDFGYEKPNTDETDQGLAAGKNLLGQLTDAVNSFNNTVGDQTKVLVAGINKSKVFFDGVFGIIPIEVTSVITGVIVFLVIRKVVGR